MKISANVVTFNEQKNIERCLKSIAFCDEIVIADSRSTDKTITICRKYTKKIFSMDFTGFSAVKNACIDRSKGEWVLSVDADEEVTPELKQAILACVNSGTADGYYIKRNTMFLGRRIKHCGWNRDYQLRLFKRSKGRFNGKPVHEAVEVKGATAKIDEPLLHYSYPDSHTYFTKMNRYTTLQAKEKQKKFPLLRILTAPFLKFFRMYFLKLGFLDGFRGFILSIYSGFSEFIKFSKMWEENNRIKEDAILLRAPNWLGDAVMFTAFINEAKRIYNRVYVAGPPAVKAMVEGNPNIEKVVIYPRKGIAATIRAAKELKRYRIATAVSFTPSFSSYLLLWLSGAKRRAGYGSDFGAFLLTDRYKQDKSHNREHVMDEYRQIMYLVNTKFNFAGIRQFVPAQSSAKKPQPGVVVSPFAKFGPSKMWPFEYYREVIGYLLKKTKQHIYVTGLPEEMDYEFGDEIKGNGRFHDMRGAGLKDVVTLVKNARLFLGNDSGMMHIADAFEIPMVVIFGGTKIGYAGPVQSKAVLLQAKMDCVPCYDKKCRYGHYKCLKEIKPETVLKAVKGLL
ncbi:MAG: glycosyltransferase [Spirochaetia bacterium]|nr:glycosyltransferase [Spirochaetia bacterium]